MQKRLIPFLHFLAHIFVGKVSARRAQRKRKTPFSLKKDSVLMYKKDDSQFYQPPLNAIIQALFMRFNSLIIPKSITLYLSFNP